MLGFSQSRVISAPLQTLPCLWRCDGVTLGTRNYCCRKKKTCAQRALLNFCVCMCVCVVDARRLSRVTLGLQLECTRRATPSVASSATSADWRSKR